MSEEKKKPFYGRGWFVILMLILIFPVGLILMWAATDWSKKTKWVVTVILGIVFLFSLGEDSEDTEVKEDENNSGEEASKEPEEEEGEAEESKEDSKTEVEETTKEDEPKEEDRDKENGGRGVKTITEEEDYVISAEIIGEDYTLGTEEDLKIFNIENEMHYRIKMDHHGGLFGSKNLDRIRDLIENITEEKAEYDYLVFEILRTDNEDEDRHVYTRFNKEQSENLLKKEEMNDDAFEEVSDFYVRGSQANIGYNKDSVNFGEMTTEELIEHSVNNINNGGINDLTINETDSGVQVNVVVEKGASWNESTAVKSMRREIVLFIGELQKHDITYDSVGITYVDTLIDPMGNESVGDVLVANFRNDTVHAINPDNVHIVAENIDSLAETWWVHPALR